MTAEPLAVLTGVLRLQRRALVLWALALAAVTALYASFYPTMGTTAEMQGLVDSLPEGMITAFGWEDITSPAGYLSSTVYGLIAPALLLVHAVALGARLLAGQEEDGTLELEASAPVGRRRLLAERLAALWLSSLALVAAVTATTLALVVVLDLDLAAGNVLAASSGLLLLVLAVGTIALAAGAVTGRRGVALGLGAGVAVLAFVADALGPLADVPWLRTISPWSWYLAEEPLATGLDLAGLGALAALVAVAAAVGLAAIERRDLMV